MTEARSADENAPTKARRADSYEEPPERGGAELRELDGGDVSSGVRFALPPWLRAADSALMLAARKVRLIQAVTANNVAAEAARLEQALAAGQRCSPCLRYDPSPPPVELCRALEKLAAFTFDQGPLGHLYGGRALELALEAEMIGAVGTPRLVKLATRRFVGPSRQDLKDAEAARQLAAAWASAQSPASTALEPCTRTCDVRDPGSLVSRMLAEVGRRRLPVRVMVERGLASLAATGDGVILVAEGRTITTADVERTVLHEIEGHVLPRVRAAKHPLGIFAIGTARGVDDQEGRALILERVTGFLGAARRRELGLRHLAAVATLEGAEFVEVAELLLDRGCDIPDAVRIVMRVQRGGTSLGGGLAREVVYLPALLRVERALAVHGAELERMMASGRVAAEAAQQILETLTSAPEAGYSEAGSAQQRVPVT